MVFSHQSRERKLGVEPCLLQANIQQLWYFGCRICTCAIDFLIYVISRITFLGLISGLYLVANMLWGCLYLRIVKRQKKLELRKQAKEGALEGNAVSNGHANISIAKNKEDTNDESTI